MYIKNQNFNSKIPQTTVVASSETDNYFRYFQHSLEPHLHRPFLMLSVFSTRNFLFMCFTWVYCLGRDFLLLLEFKLSSTLRRLKLVFRPLLPECESAWIHAALHCSASGPSRELSHIESLKNCSTSVHSGSRSAIPNQYITLFSIH